VTWPGSQENERGNAMTGQELADFHTSFPFILFFIVFMSVIFGSQTATKQQKDNLLL